MQSEKKIYIVIPIYNEAQVIFSVIQEILNLGYKNIIVVDDGSEDTTIDVLSKIENLIFLKHAINRGKGAAIKTGMETAKKLNAEMVVTMDGDGQHDPSDVKKIIQNIYNGYDIVLGSRFIIHNNIPFHKILYNHVGNFLTFLVYGQWVSDSQSGLRGYSKYAMSKIETNGDRYEYDSQIIREMRYNELKHIELPIKIRYTQYSMNKLQKQNLKNGIKTFIKMCIQ